MSKKKLLTKDKVNARTWWIVSTIVFIIFIVLIFVWNLLILPQLLEVFASPYIKDTLENDDKKSITNKILEVYSHKDLKYERLEKIEGDYSVVLDIRGMDEDSDEEKSLYNSFQHKPGSDDVTAEVVFENDKKNEWIRGIARKRAGISNLERGKIHLRYTEKDTGEEVEIDDDGSIGFEQNTIYLKYEHNYEVGKNIESEKIIIKKIKIYYDTHAYSAIYDQTVWSRVLGNSAIMFAVWLFFTIVITAYQTRIIKLNMAVKRVKSPKFEEKCPTGTSDVGRLGLNINHLLDKVKKENDRLREENRALQEKIDSITYQKDEKNDFLANTAHELKTPIAIIQGYAEGLKLGIAKGGRARQKYCDVIIDETTKMNKLVLELLELSKYKQKLYGDIKLENISIRSFVQATLNSMELILKEKNISVENTIDKKFIGRTDIEKQNHVLENYIKNAISHTDMYRKIVISCVEKPNAYRVYVYNTGEKLSEENMKNIWDSFYRVDKSHERSEGRFGIGLSIVASIQEELGMQYGVKNTYGGVQFWFDIKKPE